jgi:hypothetical protein
VRLSTPNFDVDSKASASVPIIDVEVKVEALVSMIDIDAVVGALDSHLNVDIEVCLRCKKRFVEIFCIDISNIVGLLWIGAPRSEDIVLRSFAPYAVGVLLSDIIIKILIFVVLIFHIVVLSSAKLL